MSVTVFTSFGASADDRRDVRTRAVDSRSDIHVCVWCSDVGEVLIVGRVLICLVL